MLHCLLICLDPFKYEDKRATDNLNTVISYLENISNTEKENDKQIHIFTQNVARLKYTDNHIIYSKKMTIINVMIQFMRNDFKKGDKIFLYVTGEGYDMDSTTDVDDVSDDDFKTNIVDKLPFFITLFAFSDILKHDGSLLNLGKTSNFFGKSKIKAIGTTNMNKYLTPEIKDFLDFDEFLNIKDKYSENIIIETRML